MPDELPQPLLRVSVDRSLDVQVVAAEGEVDIGTVGRLEEALADAIDAGPGDVLLDLSALDFIDSTGVQTILAGHARLEASGRRLAIVCPPGPVRGVFELMKLEKAVSLQPSQDEALRQLGG